MTRRDFITWLSGLLVLLGLAPAEEVVRQVEELPDWYLDEELPKADVEMWRNQQYACIEEYTQTGLERLKRAFEEILIHGLDEQNYAKAERSPSR